MKTKAILAGAVILAFFLALLFVSRKPSHDLTIKHFKRNFSLAYGFSETFAITNNRMSACYLYPTAIEVLEGTNWKTYSPIPLQRDIATLKPHNGMLHTIDNMTLPPERRLRLRVAVGWQSTGLNAAIMRLKLRLQGHKVELNPFSRTSAVYSDSVEVESEPFVEFAPQSQ